MIERVDMVVVLDDAAVGVVLFVFVDEENARQLLPRNHDA